MAAFTSGALLYVHAQRIRVLPLAASAVLLLVCILTGTATMVAPLPFTLIVFVLGAVLPLLGIRTKRGLSYGIYIYGVPVQNLVEVRLPELPLPVYLLLAFALPRSAGVGELHLDRSTCHAAQGARESTCGTARSGLAGSIIRRTAVSAARRRVTGAAAGCSGPAAGRIRHFPPSL